jgi:hypothetical protein
MSKLVLAGFVALSLVLPTTALAQSADEGYGAVAGAETGDPTLPFTGFELGIVLAAGLVLLATGMLLRRRSRTN